MILISGVEKRYSTDQISDPTKAKLHRTANILKCKRPSMKRSRSFRNWLSLSTAFVVLLSSCGGVTEHNETTTDTTIQPDKAVELPTLQLKDPDPANVLPALFPKGTYDATDQTIIWMPEGEAAKNMFPKDGQGNSTMVLQTLSVTGNTPKKVMVLNTYTLDKNGDRLTCHACAPMMGRAVFSREADGSWILTAWNPAMGEYGANGKPYDRTLIQIGNEKYALQVSGGFSAQGQSLANAWFYGLDNAQLIWEVQTLQSNEFIIDGRILLEKLNTTISFLPSDAAYFDAKTTTKGHRIDQVGKTRIPVNETMLYRYDASKGTYLEMNN